MELRRFERQGPSSPLDELRTRVVEFFQNSLDLELRTAEAAYILDKHFDAFCSAYTRFSDLNSEKDRESLLKIADAAIRHCTRK